MIVLPLEGVLCEQGGDLLAEPPSPIGMTLYQIFANSGEPIYVISAQRNEELAKEWLLKEGFMKFSKMISRNDSPLSFPDFQVGTVSNLLSRNHRIRFYVAPDPLVATKLLELNVPSIIPFTGRHEDPSSHQYRAWDSLVADLESSHARRARLRRLREDVQEEV